MTTTREKILNEAKHIVVGERETVYGGPEQSFQIIANFWSTYLNHPVQAHDVACMMILLKLARLQQSDGFHEDSWRDAIGYAACGAEIVGI